MRILDRILPADALSGFAHVGWRKVDPIDDQVRRGEVMVASGGWCLPAGIEMYASDPPGWQRWPSLQDLLPVVRAPRGVIEYQRAHPVPMEDGRGLGTEPVYLGRRRGRR